MIKFIPKQTAI